MLRGLQFEPWVAPVSHWRNRMDVACFIGFCRRREGVPLPVSILEWLRQEGFIDAPGQRSSAVEANGEEAIVGGVENLPIPIDDWSSFERLFELRSLTIDASTPLLLPTYLAAAVRSFFSQGGRRCIVVPIEEPADLHLRSTMETRLQAIGRLIPAYLGDVAAMEPVDRSAWRGLGVLHGLDDAAMVCVPDLPWLVGQVPEWLMPEEPSVVPRDSFVECAVTTLPMAEQVVAPPIAVGRCDLDQYLEWSAVVRLVSGFLARYRRDVQFVAALPLPVHGSLADRDPIDALLEWGILERGDDGNGPLSDGVASRFLQLGYPWVLWSGSRGLPEELEPPDGLIAGVIARSTLLRGAFQSAAGSTLYDVEGLQPTLTKAQREREPDVIPVTGGPVESALIQRLSLVGRGLRRFELLSDVTTSGDTAHQRSGTERLHAVWIRALVQAGHTLLFEPSNEATWRQVTSQLTEVGMALFRGGALHGSNPEQAFRVRCDRTTMSQRDLDSGRLVAEIEYRAVAPLELIRVSLALSENREVSVVSESREVPS